MRLQASSGRACMAFLRRMAVSVPNMHKPNNMQATTTTTAVIICKAMQTWISAWHLANISCYTQ